MSIIQSILAFLKWLLLGEPKRPKPKLVHSASDTRRKGTAHFVAKPRLLSSAETRVLKYLRSQIGPYGHVCPCVRVADIISVRSRDKSAWSRKFLSISQKHVDFAIIGTDGRVRFVVEVDDSSHREPKRQARDKLLNKAFAQAGIPLVRFEPGQEGYDAKLASQIAEMVPARAQEQSA